MYFRVKKQLNWDGKIYSPGDIIDIPEGNPRLEGLHLGGFLYYDCCAPDPDHPSGIPVEQVKKKERRKLHAQTQG